MFNHSLKICKIWRLIRWRVAKLIVKLVREYWIKVDSIIIFDYEMYQYTQKPVLIYLQSLYSNRAQVIPMEHKCQHNTSLCHKQQFFVKQTFYEIVKYCFCQWKDGMFIRRILMFLYNFSNIIQYKFKLMSLHNNHARNQTQISYHPNNHQQYSQKDQLYTRSTSTNWRAQNDCNYSKGLPYEQQENKLRNYNQKSREDQRYNLNHQKSQAQRLRSTPYNDELSLNKSKYNDFSFEEGTQRTKTLLPAEIIVRENARKRETDMKMNNIDQLNDKIHSLLSLIKKEINKSISPKKQSDRSVSPYRNNKSPYHQQSVGEYSNHLKDNKPICENKSIDQFYQPLCSIQNNQYSKSNKRTTYAIQAKLGKNNNIMISQQRMSLHQNDQYIINKSKRDSHLKTESLMIKGADQLLNQRRKMLNINSQQQRIYSFTTSKEANKQQGSPINQFKNQGKGLYTIEQNQKETLVTPTEANNRQKKYQYCLQSTPQQNEEQISNDLPGKIYKKSQQTLPKRSKSTLHIDVY